MFLPGLSQAQTASISSSGTDSSLISQLLAQIAQLQAQIQAMANNGNNSSVLTKAANSNCLNLGSDLRYGQGGIFNGTASVNVTNLQNFLKDQGVFATNPTGFYGFVTTRAVIAFQKAQGLSQTGFVDAATRAKIKELSCGNLSAISITNITGPSTLKTGQDGQWIINLTAPANITFAYTVEWGDNAISRGVINPATTTNQSVSFDHTYSAVGTYSPKFYVRQNIECVKAPCGSLGSAEKDTMVTVTDSNSTNSSIQLGSFAVSLAPFALNPNNYPNTYYISYDLNGTNQGNVVNIMSDCRAGLTIYSLDEKGQKQPFKCGDIEHGPYAYGSGEDVLTFTNTTSQTISTNVTLEVSGSNIGGNSDMVKKTITIPPTSFTPTSTPTITVTSGSVTIPDSYDIYVPSTIYWTIKATDPNGNLSSLTYSWMDKVLHPGTGNGFSQSANVTRTFTTAPSTDTLTITARDSQGLSTTRTIKFNIIPYGGTLGNAYMVSQNVPSTMVAGQSYNVSVVMRNDGSNTWNRLVNWTDHAYRLGAQNPRDNVTWGFNRVELPAATIAPDQTATFNFTVKAPSTPGTYNFQWQMVKEFEGWLGTPTTNVPVTVTAPLCTTGISTTPGSCTTPPTATLAPTITSLNPTSGPHGTLVTITGTGFGASNTILFDNGASGQVANVASTNGGTTLTWTSSPYGVIGTTYKVSVRNNSTNTTSNSVNYTVTADAKDVVWTSVGVPMVTYLAASAPGATSTLKATFTLNAQAVGDTMITPAASDFTVIAQGATSTPGIFKPLVSVVVMPNQNIASGSSAAVTLVAALAANGTSVPVGNYYTFKVVSAKANVGGQSITKTLNLSTSAGYLMAQANTGLNQLADILVSLKAVLLGLK